MREPGLGRIVLFASKKEEKRHDQGARCSNGPRSGRKRRSSIQPDYDRTVDGEAGASEFGSSGACKRAVLNECEDVEFFAKLSPIAAIDCGLRPFVEVGIPGGTVIQCY